MTLPTLRVLITEAEQLLESVASVRSYEQWRAECDALITEMNTDPVSAGRCYNLLLKLPAPDPATLPPAPTAYREITPLDVLAETWNVSIETLRPPRAAEPAKPVPIAGQLPAPDYGPNVSAAPELGYLSHAGFPVPGASGCVIPATPKAKPKREVRMDPWADMTVAERYEHLLHGEPSAPAPQDYSAYSSASAYENIARSMGAVQGGSDAPIVMPKKIV